MWLGICGSIYFRIFRCFCSQACLRFLSIFRIRCSARVIKFRLSPIRLLQRRKTWIKEWKSLIRWVRLDFIVTHVKVRPCKLLFFDPILLLMIVRVGCWISKESTEKEVLYYFSHVHHYCSCSFVWIRFWYKIRTMFFYSLALFLLLFFLFSKEDWW